MSTISNGGYKDASSYAVGIYPASLRGLVKYMSEKVEIQVAILSWINPEI
jgi:hypothetical protein